MANEYVIVNADETEWVVMSGSSAGVTRSILFASKFKAKQRAEAIARKVGMAVVPFWGGVVYSTKQEVKNGNGQINRRSPYRSC